MEQQKKHPGNQDPHKKPIHVKSKRNRNTSGNASGNPESIGGSRQGNAGHQSDRDGNNR